MTFQNMDQKNRPEQRRYARNPNLDFIRCVAIVSVLSVHFFLDTGFYTMRIQTAGVAASLIIRDGLMVCVPLFLLLTGYLCNQKRLSPGYVKGLLPILITYVLACLASILERSLRGFYQADWWESVLQILAIGNGAIVSAWYVEMYIGLYLLIPFLNLIYHNLETKQNKQILLGVFLFLTMAPLCLNDIDWMTPGFWEQLNRSDQAQEILPSWWTGIWPLTYYFLGAYIREYDVKIPKWKNLLLLLVSVLGFGLIDVYRNWGGCLRSLNSSQWGSLQNTVNSVLLFLLLLHMDLSKMPKGFLSLLYRISKLSFGIYLCSDVSDRLVYRMINQLPVSFSIKYLCMPLAVLGSLVIAALLSQLIGWMQDALFWTGRKLKTLRSAR